MSTVTPEIEARARALRDRLTPAEKLGMLSGGVDFYRFMAGMPGTEAGVEAAAEAGRRPTPAAAVERLGLAGSASPTDRGASRWECPPAFRRPWPGRPPSTTTWRNGWAKPWAGRHGPTG